MLRKVAMTVMTLSLGGCLLLISPPASEAQPGAGGGAGAPPASGGSTVAPRGGGGERCCTAWRWWRRRHPTSGPNDGHPASDAHRHHPAYDPHGYPASDPYGHPACDPHGHPASDPHGHPACDPHSHPACDPHRHPACDPHGHTRRGTRTVTAARLRGAPARGAGRFIVGGQNYSAWRSGYRVRRGSGWRTFVALSALGAIAIGSNQYYPYAYISAPEPYCDGLTEDGCQLMWQEVETIEGDVINQCVAYCPWQ